MGEDALLNGQRIKIGSCEDMYYLRWEQRHFVRPVQESVNPVRDGEAGHLRFRFPFPDEDQVRPGDFEDHTRGVFVRGIKTPDVVHGTVQFSAPGGYLVSLPCPEGPEVKDLTFHRNGHQGGFRVVQQKFVHGDLTTLCECTGCGSTFRLDTLEEAQPIIDFFRKEARSPYGRGEFFSKMADRIEAGYRHDVVTPKVETSP